MGADWYHCSVQSFGRASGRSAVAAAAYRAGVALEDERNARTCDYTRKTGVADRLLFAPPGTPGHLHTRAAIWNAAEAAETRKNARTAREVRLALPAEVSDAARREIVRDVSKWLVRTYGVAADAAIHRPHRQGDQRNHHAHIMVTTRAITAEGLGAKTRALDDRKTGPQEIERIRSYAAGAINRVLERERQPGRVDHRSYARRGIERTPTVHEGRHARHAWRKAQEQGRDWKPAADAPGERPRGRGAQAKAARMRAYRETTRPDHNAAIRDSRRRDRAPARRSLEPGRAAAWSDDQARARPAAPSPEKARSRAADGQQPARAASSKAREPRFMSNQDRNPGAAGFEAVQQNSGPYRVSLSASFGHQQQTITPEHTPEPSRPREQAQERTPAPRLELTPPRQSGRIERPRLAPAQTPERQARDLVAKRDEIEHARQKAVDQMRGRHWDAQGNLRMQQESRDAERMRTLEKKRERLQERQQARKGLGAWWRGITGADKADRAELAEVRKEISRIRETQSDEIRNLSDHQRRETDQLNRDYRAQRGEVERKLERLHERYPGRDQERDPSRERGGGRERGGWTRGPEK